MVYCGAFQTFPNKIRSPENHAPKIFTAQFSKTSPINFSFSFRAYMCTNKKCLKQYSVQHRQYIQSTRGLNVSSNIHRNAPKEIQFSF